MDSAHPRRLPASTRDELGDIRLVLETAAHNAQAAGRIADFDEALLALDNALAMAAQAHASLLRIRQQIA